MLLCQREAGSEMKPTRWLTCVSVDLTDVQQDKKIQKLRDTFLGLSQNNDYFLFFFYEMHIKTVHMREGQSRGRADCSHGSVT